MRLLTDGSSIRRESNHFNCRKRQPTHTADCGPVSKVVAQKKDVAHGREAERGARKQKKKTLSLLRLAVDVDDQNKLTCRQRQVAKMISDGEVAMEASRMARHGLRGGSNARMNRSIQLGAPKVGTIVALERDTQSAGLVGCPDEEASQH